MNDTKRPIFFRVRMAWGRRRANPGQPAHSLSFTASESATPTNGASDNTREEENLSELSASYPWLYIYDTPEQAAAAAARRNASREGLILPPRVTP